MMKDIRILQVCPSLHEGGVERSTVEMANFITSKGSSSHVAANHGQLVDEITSSGTKFHPLPLHMRNPATIIHNALRLAKIIRDNDISLIHVRSRAPAWSVLLASKWTGVSFITTFHGTYGTKWWGKKFYNSVMLKGRAVIANSEFIRQHIANTYKMDTKDIPVAPRGYDTEKFDPNNIPEKDLSLIRKDLNIPENTPIILMVGRLTRWKGQHVLLEALSKINNIPWIALFAGSAGKNSAYANELKELAKSYKIENHVRWLGSRDDVHTLYKLANLAVSASTNPEAFGRVAVEAQSMGTPIIATAHGGSLETVRDGHTGWLIPPENANILAQAIHSALTDLKKLDTMSKAARLWVSENFTTQQTCQKEWAVYMSVLEQLHDEQKE